MPKRLKILIGIISFVFLVLLVGSVGGEPDKPERNKPKEAGIVDVMEQERQTDKEKPEPEKPQTTFYEVVKVIDGDTVAVMVNGQKEAVRLIGIDTPETVHPNKQVECFGKERSSRYF